MIFFSLKGLLLGAVAGISPGPLTLLLVRETLRHGAWAGIRVALIPLLTDLPIVLLAFYLAGHLAQMSLWLSLMSVVGAVMVAWIGFQQFQVAPIALDQKAPVISTQQAFWVNFLSPHPWLFWATIGAPLLARGMHHSTGHGLLFLGGFYIALVGSKAMLALLGAHCRSYLQGKTYIWTQRLLGILLILMALLLLGDAWHIWQSYR